MTRTIGVRYVMSGGCKNETECCDRPDSDGGSLLEDRPGQTGRFLTTFASDTIHLRLLRSVACANTFAAHTRTYNAVSVPTP